MRLHYLILISLIFIAFVFTAGCDFNSIVYSNNRPKDLPEKLIDVPERNTPKGCNVPYEKLKDDMCCIVLDGKDYCDVGDEVYSLCSQKFGVAPGTVIIYYTDWCQGCDKVLGWTKELPKFSFYLSNKERNSRIVTDYCFIDKLGIGLPQYICSSDGEVGLGIRSKSDLMNFAQNCQMKQ